MWKSDQLQISKVSKVALNCKSLGSLSRKLCYFSWQVWLHKKLLSEKRFSPKSLANICLAEEQITCSIWHWEANPFTTTRVFRASPTKQEGPTQDHWAIVFLLISNLHKGIWPTELLNILRSFEKLARILVVIFSNPDNATQFSWFFKQDSNFSFH